MFRPFRYLAFAGSSVLSCIIAYKLRSRTYNDTGLVYAAGAPSVEVLRSALGNETKRWDTNWDFRESIGVNVSKKYGSASEKQHVPSLAEHLSCEQTPVDGGKSSVTRHLVFIRHGQYVTKADDDKKKILTPLGRQQAEHTGKRLQLLSSGKFPVDKIVISSMTRARETGDIIRSSLPDVPYEYCDLLREGAPCFPEPSSSRWRPEHQEIYQDSARIEAAFRKYFHRADPKQKKECIEVFVCHANVIRYFVCRALQFPAEGWLRFSIGNCGITWLSISPSGRVILRSMGDTGHLSPNMITTG